jgi:hypothetical protein
MQSGKGRPYFPTSRRTIYPVFTAKNSFLLYLGQSLVYSPDQLRQFNGGHRRKQMVLQVVKHTEGNFVFPAAALGADSGCSVP